MWRHLTFALSLWAIRVHSSADKTLLDWLIQDVCQDANGQQIPGDPATCASHRNINIGERTPFLLTDVDHNNNGATYESFNSIPVHAQDGTLKVLISKNNQGNFNADFKFSFSVARDAYDLIDVTFSNYASIIRTSDGGCYDQMFSPTGDVSSTSARAGGWPLFPYSGYTSAGNAQDHTYKVQISQKSGCSSGNSVGVAFWNPPTQYTFETGKTLTAIKQYHFASTALGNQNNAMELYYFTKEYGATRWESWIPQSRCFAENGSGAGICHPENPSIYPLQGRCSKLVVSATGIAGLDTWGNQKWVRNDCRDETNYIALNTPQLMVDNVMAQNDGYVDINYAKTVAGQ